VVVLIAVSALALRRLRERRSRAPRSPRLQPRLATSGLEGQTGSFAETHPVDLELRITVVRDSIMAGEER
jgi:hypothetical protein